MSNINQRDEATRRARQANLGLFFQPETSATNQQDDIMQEHNATTSSSSSQRTRAEAVIDHLSKPPSFREVAIYEAKKAAIWAPILATTLLGALWVNKRFILKAASGV